LFERKSVPKHWARRTADRVPMVKMPVIGQAFDEIIIDVMVVVDGATRFVECIDQDILKIVRNNFFCPTQCHLLI
jgi:hypothetical protein